jgi:dolichyl-diphosphooligosaccharide--protein glycosyltransferase
MATETASPATPDFQYYGTYDEETFTYPDSVKGTLSWWDYGHWITVTGQQVPISNPFQQHAPYAATVLLSTEEDDVDALTREQFGDEAELRYVIVDWKMVTPTSKMGALTVFDESVEPQDLSRPTYFVSGSSIQSGTTLLTERYYQSFAVRLYHFHGSAVLPEPYVVTTQRQQVQTRSGNAVTVETVPQDTPFVQRFDSVDAAQAYAQQSPSAQLGGIGTLSPEYVPALQQYRLVKVSPEASFEDRGYENSIRRDLSLTRLSPTTLVETPSWVKVFERVPGATISGQGPANATVQAAVPLYVPEFNQTFTYQQYAETDETGQFEMVLPYSTTGYESFSPETGYTNTSIRATTPYQFTSIVSDSAESNQSFVVYRSESHVSESAVVGATDSVVRIELERSQFAPEETSSTETVGNTTAAPTASEKS